MSKVYHVDKVCTPPLHMKTDKPVEEMQRNFCISERIRGTSKQAPLSIGSRGVDRDHT